MRPRGHGWILRKHLGGKLLFSTCRLSVLMRRDHFASRPTRGQARDDESSILVHPLTLPRPQEAPDLGKRSWRRRWGIDQFRRCHFDCEVDDGSLDRMTEAATMRPPAPRGAEHQDARPAIVRPHLARAHLDCQRLPGMSETEPDLETAAKLKTHGDRYEMLTRSAPRREVEAKAKRPQWNRKG